MGKTGLKLSEIALGSWLTLGGSVDRENSLKCIQTAIDNGVNYIDTADVYSGGNAEKLIGEFLNEETVNRKDLVIASKVYWPLGEGPNDKGLSRKHIMESIQGTLDRLNTDYLDIYFCHRYDVNTPIKETIGAMDDLIKLGKIHYWGTSVWTSAKLERAAGMAKYMNANPPAVEQPQYNMISRYIETEVLETVNFLGMGVVPFSPLAQGILTGKYNNGVPKGSRGERTDWLKWDLNEPNLDKVRKISPLADELGISMANLSLAWILRRKEITSIITGASKPEHVQENVKAVDIELSQEILDKIEKILQNKPELPGIYHPPDI